MHTIIRGESANVIYRRLALKLSNEPDFEPEVRGLQTKEVINCSLVLDNPRDNLVTLVERDIDLRYLAGELCFYLSGSNKLTDINKYSSFWNKVSDDGEIVNSAYGYNLFVKNNNAGITQFDYVIDCLKADIHTRKAVAFLSGPDDAKESKDNICTTTLQFLIRDGKLNMITTMRSNDINYGLTYDLPFFTILQQIVAIKLGVELGAYMHNVGSMHVYANFYEHLDKIKGSYKANEAIHMLPEIVEHDIEHWFQEMFAYQDTGKKGLTTEFQQVLIRWLGKEKK